MEACLAVPVFFISLVPFLYLMRMSLTQNLLEVYLENAVEQLAVESYILFRDTGEEKPEESDSLSGEALEGAGELQEMKQEMKEFAAGGDSSETLAMDFLGTFFLRERVLSLLEGENLSSLGILGGERGLSFLGSRLFFSESGHDHLIEGRITISWESPFSFWEPPETILVRTARAFTGRSSTADPASENSDASDSQTEEVFRIGEGSHYHRKSCFLIEKDIRGISPEEAALMQLTACSRCQPEDGGVVYITGGGSHYHRISCGYLFPELTGMSLEEALELGLLPCGLCYGDNDYFR